MTRNLPTQHGTSRGALVAKFAEKFGVDQNKLFSILKATAFKLPASKDDGPPPEVSDEQMAALLIVADQYGLNPFTREIYAFPDKGKGIVPIVGVDGWTRIMNEHPQFDGLEFRYAENVVQVDDDAKPCPEWTEAIVYRKDRSRPTVIREYLDECYKPAFEGNGRNGKYKIKGPWQSHTRRFLRHKALIQGVRTAFGFAGVYDEDEGERIASARVVNMEAGMPRAIDAEVVDSAEEFERKVQTLALPAARSASLGQFLDLTAKANGVEASEVKAQAAVQFDAFMEQFQAWEGTQAKAKPAGQRRQSPKTKTESEPTQAEQPEQGPKDEGDTQDTAKCPRRADRVVMIANECADCAHRKGCPALPE